MGFALVEALLGSALLGVLLMFVASHYGFLFRTVARTRRETDVHSFLEQRLNTVKATLGLSGGLNAFIRLLEDSGVNLNPVLTKDLDAPSSILVCPNGGQEQTAATCLLNLSPSALTNNTVGCTSVGFNGGCLSETITIDSLSWTLSYQFQLLKTVIAPPVPPADPFIDSAPVVLNTDALMQVALLRVTARAIPVSAGSREQVQVNYVVYEAD